MDMRIAAGAGLLCLVGSADAADELPFLKTSSEYSATRIIETSEGNFEQKVHWTDSKVRTETNIEGVTLLNIVREDLGVMWISNPMLGRCLEQPVDSLDETAQLGEQYASDEVDYEEVGEDTIDGRATTKYEVRAQDSEMGAHKAYMWTTDENILVRMEMEPLVENVELSFTMRLEDLEIGPQDPALFESPGDCVSLEDVPRR